MFEFLWVVHVVRPDVGRPHCLRLRLRRRLVRHTARREEQKRKRIAARASQDAVHKVRPVRRFTSVLARLAGASNHMLKGVGTRQECCASRGNSCCCYSSRAWDKGGRVVAPVFGREPVRAAAVVVASRAAKSVAICTSCCALCVAVFASGSSRHKLKVRAAGKVTSSASPCTVPACAS